MCSECLSRPSPSQHHGSTAGNNFSIFRVLCRNDSGHYGNKHLCLLEGQWLAYGRHILLWGPAMINWGPIINPLILTLPCSVGSSGGDQRHRLERDLLPWTPLTSRRREMTVAVERWEGAIQTHPITAQWRLETHHIGQTAQHYSNYFLTQTIIQNWGILITLPERGGEREREGGREEGGGEGGYKGKERTQGVYR